MQLKVLQENFSKALITASRFASSKVQLPVLANILLSASKNKLLISATNLEVSICLTVGAKVEKDGKITVPARTLTDLVSNLGSGQLSISSKKERLSMASSGFKSTISGMNASDFPSVPQKAGKGSLKLPGDKLIDALSCVLFAASNDETRPVLTGVLTILAKDRLTLVSTDGFRLSQKVIDVKSNIGETKLTLPKNALSELTRLSDDEDNILFSFQKAENQVVFEVSDAVLTSRIIEGEFPDFEKIIPKRKNLKVNLDKGDLLRAVKLASVFARDSANVVNFSLSNDSVSISAESSQSGKQETDVDAKVEGELGKEGFEIAFNYRFLEDFLNAMKGEDVEIQLTDANAPAVFLDSKDKDFLHIIMPVRITS